MVPLILRITNLYNTNTRHDFNIGYIKVTERKICNTHIMVWVSEENARCSLHGEGALTRVIDRWHVRYPHGRFLGERSQVYASH